jgi:sulfur relay (sulfurtransferase) DsrF/TusC family protein
VALCSITWWTLFQIVSFIHISSLNESRLSEYQSEVDALLLERTTLMEQIQQLTSQPTKGNVEIQTVDNLDL